MRSKSPRYLLDLPVVRLRQNPWNSLRARAQDSGQTSPSALQSGTLKNILTIRSTSVSTAAADRSLRPPVLEVTDPSNSRPHPRVGNEPLIEEAPPPPYSESYGQVDISQDGFDTQARVAGKINCLWISACFAADNPRCRRRSSEHQHPPEVSETVQPFGSCPAKPTELGWRARTAISRVYTQFPGRTTWSRAATLSQRGGTCCWVSWGHSTFRCSRKGAEEYLRPPSTAGDASYFQDSRARKWS